MKYMERQSMSCIRTFNIVKMSILLKLIYKVSVAILTENDLFFSRNWQASSEIYMEI
jgi:hypothetical protein